MKQNRPWSIWWDFRHYDTPNNANYKMTVILQTNHPDYDHIDFFKEYELEEIQNKKDI